MLMPIALVLAFVAVVMIIQGVASAVFSAGDRTRRVNRRLSLLNSGMARDDVYASLMRKRPGGRLAAAAPDVYERAAVYCRQTGLTLSPQMIGGIIVGAALALWAGAVFLLSALTGGIVLLNVAVSLIGAIGLAVTGGLITLATLRSRRLKKIETQLPLALDIVTRALRAGHPLISAVQLAAEEMGDPIGSEFGLIVDETTYGLEFRAALTNLARRTGSPYAHYFAVSVGIQAETGGNLAEILGNLATVIRNRQTLHLRVAALASEGKMSALILSALPVLLVTFLMLTQPTFYTSKFDDPIFWPGATGVAVLYLIGRFIIYRMVNFKY
jgi:tight adherence protein B